MAGKRLFVLAIDPGTTESAFCLVRREDYMPCAFAKIPNEELFEKVMYLTGTGGPYDLVIEMVASYGMPVGREVFETCVWIGRFIERLGLSGRTNPKGHALIYRQEEKLSICHDPKANDATIRQALVDRFAYGEKNYGKGTKNEPGFFYGFSKDIWQAFAVAVTYIDKEESQT